MTATDVPIQKYMTNMPPMVNSKDDTRTVVRLCPHKRTGRVTNQPWGFDEQRPFACQAVCSKPVCIRVAKVWVTAHTEEPAEYVPDEAGEEGGLVVWQDQTPTSS